MHWFFTCDTCGRPEEGHGLLESAMEEIRKKGWLIRRKKRRDPTYRMGDNNFYYYCPECRKKV